MYESLRLFPPISQLLNRRTSRDVCLGGKIPIPAGTYVGYNAYATGRNKQAWGDDADVFRPERWGVTIEDINSRYRQASSRAEFIAFHGGRRACLGQRFALLQVRITMIVLLRALKWRIDPSWQEAMTPVRYTQSARLWNLGLVLTSFWPLLMSVESFLGRSTLSTATPSRL